jgi:hypothetical protein
LLRSAKGLKWFDELRPRDQNVFTALDRKARPAVLRFAADDFHHADAGVLAGSEEKLAVGRQDKRCDWLVVQIRFERRICWSKGCRVRQNGAVPRRHKQALTARTEDNVAREAVDVKDSQLFLAHSTG